MRVVLLKPEPREKCAPRPGRSADALLATRSPQPGANFYRFFFGGGFCYENRLNGLQEKGYPYSNLSTGGPSCVLLVCVFSCFFFLGRVGDSSERGNGSWEQVNKEALDALFEHCLLELTCHFQLDPCPPTIRPFSIDVHMMHSALLEAMRRFLWNIYLDLPFHQQRMED